jgi:hypothetical protein
METHKHQSGGQHDDREIDVRTIVRLSVLLAVVTAGTLGLTWFFTSSLAQSERRAHPRPAPIATAGPTAPVEPRLQPSPPEGLKALRTQEDKKLTSYEWIDKEAGVVAIPIDRAMDLFVQRAPPARERWNDTTAPSRPTQSSLGEKKGAAP